MKQFPEVYDMVINEAKSRNIVPKAFLSANEYHSKFIDDKSSRPRTRPTTTMAYSFGMSSSRSPRRKFAFETARAQTSHSHKKQRNSLNISRASTSHKNRASLDIGKPSPVTLDSANGPKSAKSRLGASRQSHTLDNPYK